MGCCDQLTTSVCTVHPASPLSRGLCLEARIGGRGLTPSGLILLTLVSLVFRAMYFPSIISNAIAGCADLGAEYHSSFTHQALLLLVAITPCVSRFRQGSSHETNMPIGCEGSTWYSLPYLELGRTRDCSTKKKKKKKTITI